MWWRGFTGCVEERGSEAKDAVLGWVVAWGRGVVGRDIVVVGKGGGAEGRNIYIQIGGFSAYFS